MSEQKVTCCIVGAGPAGVVLSYMLAQQGVEVLLLESHLDFDRDFRGDTIHGGIMELLDQMGLVKDLLKLPHAKMPALGLTVNGQSQQLIDFRLLNVPFPYVTMMPQSQFLQFIVDRAKLFPSFRIQLGARATGLIESGDGFAVKFKHDTSEHRVEADLVVATDGRHSTVRKQLRFEPVKNSVPMDVIWFRVPRAKNDGLAANAHISGGHLLIVLERTDEWQIGFVFLHGGFREIKSRGIEWLKNESAKVLPALASGMRSITDWSDVAVLSVESSRLKRWYDRNVLLIGDAAHVMSPVGGVGINYAIMDAIQTAAIVAPALLGNTLQQSHLAQVQKKRMWPTRAVQGFQGILQRRFVKAALKPNRPFKMPWFVKFRFVRKLMARFISYGLFRVEIPKANRTPQRK